MNKGEQQIPRSPSENDACSDEVSFSAGRTAKLFSLVLLTAVAGNAILLLPSIAVNMMNSHFEEQERREKDQAQKQRFIELIENGEHVGEATRLLYGIEEKSKDVKESSNIDE